MGNMTSKIKLSRFLDLFGPDDGQLPDVLVQGGNRADWVLVGDALDGLGWVSEDVRLFAKEIDPLRRISVDPIPGVRIIFTGLDEPTWDFDRREMKTQAAVDCLIQLAAAVGTATAKPILFIPEGARPERAVIRYEPESRAFALP